MCMIFGGQCDTGSGFFSLFVFLCHSSLNFTSYSSVSTLRCSVGPYDLHVIRFSVVIRDFPLNRPSAGDGITRNFSSDFSGSNET